MTSTPHQKLLQMKLADNQNKLKNYVDNVNTKVDNAKWKQNLILKYNYIPLEIIKQKIQKDREIYLQKLRQGESKLKKQLNNEKIEQQVEVFKDLGNKLYEQMKQIQQQIQCIKMNKKIHEAEVETKKKRLKGIIKDNGDLNKTIISFKNTQLEENKKPNQTARESKHGKGKSLIDTKLYRNTERYRTTSKVTEYTQPGINIDTTKQLYEDCVKSMIKSLRVMNGTQDIQTGIYLQIMNRKIHKRQATYSIKSKTCDVLMDRYKDLRKQKPKYNEDFSMSYQTFSNLNYKQIMGIILVKDRNAESLKNLLLKGSFSI